MRTENSKKSKSSSTLEELNTNKKLNVNNAKKSGQKNITNQLDILTDETWDYMNEVEDLRYEIE